MLTSCGPLGVQELYPARCRAQGAAVFQLLVTLMGLGAGPAAIAAASDYLLQPAHELGPRSGARDSDLGDRGEQPRRLWECRRMELPQIARPPRTADVPGVSACRFSSPDRSRFQQYP